MSRLVNRSVWTKAGRTSVRLEPEFWDALDEVCRRERCSRNEVLHRAEEIMTAGGRTSALRVYLFQYFVAAATDVGHEASGHG